MSMPAYEPTHVVPESGLPAWSDPDPTQPPVATLDPRLDVQVVETAGQWAHVRCSNGWTAWVDGNALRTMAVPASVAPSAVPIAGRPAPTRTGSAVRTPLGLVGGALALLGVFLPWFSIAGNDSNAFYFPVAFLWSTDEAGSGDASLVSIGGLVVLLALVIAAMSFIGNTNARRIAGAVTALVGLVHAIEVQRLLSDTPGAPGLFSVLGYGAYVSLAGGVLAAAVGARSRNT